MGRHRFYAITVLVFSLLLVAGLPAEEKKRVSAAASITLDELKDHLYFLASDELGGRLPGEEGYDTAVKYSATQFRAAGLKTLYKDKNGKDTFLQSFDLVRKKTSKESAIVVAKNGEETQFKIDEDFILFMPGDSLSNAAKPLELVFLGYGIEEPKHDFNDYEGLDIKGKIAVVMFGAPMKDGKPVLPKELHQKYAPQNGMRLKYESVREHGAAGYMIVPPAQMLAAWKMLVRQFGGRASISLADTKPKDTDDQSSMAILFANKGIVEALFEGTSYNPVTLEGTYDTFELEGVQAVLDFKADNTPFPTANVVAFVPGSDPELKDEYITLGAHLDHEGVRNNAVFNGADDNASGSVAILEAAEALAMTPPRRSVILVLYSAEEMGLLGSEYFVENCPMPLDKMVAHINLDMVGRDDDDIGEAVYAIGSDKISSEFKKLLIATNEATVNLELDFRLDENDPERWFFRSDQLHFHNKGIPVVFLTSGEHPDYHRPTDDAEKIDFEKLQKITRLCYELTMAVGNKDQRLKIDNPGTK